MQRRAGRMNWDWRRRQQDARFELLQLKTATKRTLDGRVHSGMGQARCHTDPTGNRNADSKRIKRQYFVKQILPSHMSISNWRFLLCLNPPPPSDGGEGVNGLGLA